MQLMFGPKALTEREIDKLRAATEKDRDFAEDVLSGRIKFRECSFEGRVIGHCIGNVANGEIIGVSVDEPYRRRGIAKKLLHEVVWLMRADGVARIWLAAPADPALPARKFFGALGWRQTEYLPGGEVVLEPPT